MVLRKRGQGESGAQNVLSEYLNLQLRNTIWWKLQQEWKALHYTWKASIIANVDIHNWDSERRWRSVSCAEQQQSNITCKRPNAPKVVINVVETTNQLHAAQSFCETNSSSARQKNSPISMESEGSLLCSNESNPCQLSLKTNFLIIHALCTRLSNGLDPMRSPTNCLHVNFSQPTQNAIWKHLI